MDAQQRNPQRLSLNTIEFSEIGAESRRSKVFTRRSRVNETGSICEAENDNAKHSPTSPSCENVSKNFAAYIWRKFPSV